MGWTGAVQSNFHMIESNTLARPVNRVVRCLPPALIYAEPFAFSRTDKVGLRYMRLLDVGLDHLNGFP